MKNHVIVLHSGESSTGGIANATIFYAAALGKVGFNAEVWTPVRELAARCESLAIPAFHNDWLKSAGLAIISPKVVEKALAARGTAVAIIHQGSKLWLFGRIWLRNSHESVVFHNEKIGQRRLFRTWLALSEGRRDELSSSARARNLNREIRAIRNGPLPTASNFLSRSGVIRTIGCIGNFGRKKAVNVLVHAFASLCNKGHDIRLVLAGDGPERGLCRRIAERQGVANRIDWPGWVSDTRLFFQTIDLFVLPSRDEPFGIVLTEAMQAALPVVATSTKGPSDIVVQGETGWLVPPDDADALSKSMEDAIANPGKARAYGLSGYERFQRMYSLSAAGDILSQHMR